MFQFIQSSPEAVGIKSSHIFNMIQRLEALDIPMHSILIMRYDKLIYEGYYAPYTNKKPHRMFSISKTLTSLAIGHLITKKRLQLDDHIVDYFPEKCPDNIHSWIQQMTIRNMLEMRTCHSVTTYKHNMNKDWVESFFQITPDHPAGTIFHYDTGSAHVLCALVEKLTHKKLYDYIRDDVMPELSLSPDGYILSDPFGTSMGGSGLCCTSMDIMKIGYFLLNKGHIYNRTSIAPEFMELACSNINPTIVKSGNPSEAWGYGYQIWQHAKDGYCAYGMGGQYILIFPKENIILVTTADTQGYGGANLLIHTVFFEEVLDKINSSPLPENPKEQTMLQNRTLTLSLPLVKGSSSSHYTENIFNHEYQLLDNKLGFTTAKLSFEAGHAGTLTLAGASQTWRFRFGLHQMAEGILPNTSLYYVANGAWLTEQVLYIKGHICDSSVGSFHIQLHFTDNQLTIFYKVIEETLAPKIPAGHLIGYAK